MQHSSMQCSCGQQRAFAALTSDEPCKLELGLAAACLAEAGRFLTFFFLPSRISH